MNTAIDNALTKAHAMLDLKEDWDDEGALTISAETFGHVINLLLDTPVGTPVPDIGPCHDGSIDIHWRARELLVNVGEKVTYYGWEPEVKGEILTVKNWRTLMAWLNMAND